MILLENTYLDKEFIIVYQTKKVLFLVEKYLNSKGFYSVANSRLRDASKSSA